MSDPKDKNGAPVPGLPRGPLKVKVEGTPVPGLPGAPSKMNIEDRRQKIKELNHTRISIGKIAEAIGLSKTQVRRELRYLAKDPSNDIVINHSSWHVPLEQQKWFKIISYIRDTILPFYSKRFKIKPSLRATYYRLEVDGFEADYKTLVKYTVKARWRSLYCSEDEKNHPKLPIDCFSDDSREILGEFDDSPPVQSKAPQDPKDYIQKAIDALKNAPSRYTGKAIKGSDPGRWYKQPVYVEVWVEKQGLGPVFIEFLRGKDVYVVPNKGYTGTTYLYNNCKRLAEFLKNHPGNDIRIEIKYFGDFNPSGDDMIRDVEDRARLLLRVFGISGKVKFEAVAIKLDQIEKYKLPMKPEDAEKLQKLRNDPRGRRFGNKYGDLYSVEIDALLAKKPDEFKKIVINSVDGVWKQEIYDDNCPKEEFDSIDPETVRHDMYYKITESFRQGWVNDYINKHPRIDDVNATVNDNPNDPAENSEAEDSEEADLDDTNSN